MLTVFAIIGYQNKRKTGFLLLSISGLLLIAARAFNLYLFYLLISSEGIGNIINTITTINMITTMTALLGTILLVIGVALLAFERESPSQYQM